MTASRGSLMTHPVETNLVVVLPVDVYGDPVPHDNPPQIVMVDGDRIIVCATGILLEKWKSEVIIDSMCYRHVFTEALLGECDIEPGTPEWDNRLGIAIEPGEYSPQSKPAGPIKSCYMFSVREPSPEELMQVTLPVDNIEFDRVAMLNGDYQTCAIDHGDELRAAMRANPNTDVERLFKAFVLAFYSNVDMDDGDNQE